MTDMMFGFMKTYEMAAGKPTTLVVGVVRKD